MRKRPSWIVKKDVPEVPASWAVSTLEPASSALPASAPPSVPRLSLVPPPPASAGPSEVDELRQEIVDLRAALAAGEEAMTAIRVCHEAEKAELVGARARLISEAQSAVVRLSTAIAERAVGRELQASPALIEEWAAEAVAILGGGALQGNEVSFEGSVVEVTPAARVSAVASALEDRKAA